MAESYIKIGADGINVEDIVRQIRERAETRRRNGDFDMELVARAERFNLSAVKDDEDFFDRYISCLRLVTHVDITDFEIVEHRSGIKGRIAKLLKKIIWGQLRFYTYRLWSQQNQVNDLFDGALEIVAKRDAEQIKKLQTRVDELEARLAKLEDK